MDVIQEGDPVVGRQPGIVQGHAFTLGRPRLADRTVDLANGLLPVDPSAGGEISWFRWPYTVTDRVKPSHRGSGQNQPGFCSISYTLCLCHASEFVRVRSSDSRETQAWIRSDRRPSENGPYTSSSEPGRRRPSGPGRQDYTCTMVSPSCQDHRSLAPWGSLCPLSLCPSGGSCGR